MKRFNINATKKINTSDFIKYYTNLLNYFPSLIIMLFFTVGLTSCSKDKDEDLSDNTETSYLITEYGKVIPTGTKTFNLYARRSDGPTELKIPGFATIYCLLNYIDAPYLTSENEANEFSNGGSYWQTSTSTISCTVRIATLNSKNTPYVYAKIDLIDKLYGPDNKKIGVKIRYESPIEWEE